MGVSRVVRRAALLPPVLLLAVLGARADGALWSRSPSGLEWRVHRDDAQGRQDGAAWPRLVWLVRLDPERHRLSVRVAPVGTAGLSVTGLADDPAVVAGINAFTRGVREANPDAEVRVVWPLSWFDPPAEKQAAVALVEAGADVVAQHQDTPSPVQGAAEKGAWAIGSESDMTSFAPEKYLTGTIWDWCPFYKQAIAMVKDGTFEPGEFYGDLNDGTVAIAPLNDAVPEEIRALVDKRRAELTDGSFDYWKGPLMDNTGNEVVAGGATLDIGAINGMNWLVEGVVGTLPN